MSDAGWIVSFVNADGCETLAATTHSRAIKLYRAICRDTGVLFACAGPKGGPRSRFVAYIPDGMKWAF